MTPLAFFTHARYTARIIARIAPRITPAVLVTALLVRALVHPAGLPAQRLNRDPAAARYITDDLPRFWAAYDAREALGAALAFDSLYLRVGTPGLRDFARLRFKDAATIARVVAARPLYYASIRESTAKIAQQEATVRAAFRTLAALYPDAVFPDVYFVVGALTTGGTTSESGLLIGAEMYGRTTDDKLDKMSAWHRDVLAPVERLPAIVAHELCHYQQGLTNASTLLERSLREGSCDFVGELLSGLQLTHKAAAYGLAHEHALWEEFRAKMDGTDVNGWLYGGTAQTDRPADLGYFIGYQIAKAWFAKQPDKTAALRTLFALRDVKRLVVESGYAP